MLFDVDLTLGHVLRHAPGRGRAGLEAALLDIAQDLMLGWLHERGVIDGFVFKGGTALRKLYAGAEGRFSTDLDFAVREPGTNRHSAGEAMATEVDGLRIGPFLYGTAPRQALRHDR